MAQGLRALVAIYATAALPAALRAQATAPTSRPEPKEQVRALLTRCLGPFAEDAKLNRALLRIDSETPRESVRAALDLPGRLRLESIAQQQAWTLVVRGEQAWLSRDGGAASADADGKSLAERWRSFLRAVCLEPLSSCVAATRQGPTVLALRLEGGETWRLETDQEGTRPLSLIGPGCEVAFVDFTDTPRTHMPRRVRSRELGERLLRFEDADVRFEDLVFFDLGTRIDALRKQRPGHKVGGERKPRKPTLQEVGSDLLLVLDDPGTWPERIKAVWAAMAVLRAAGQRDAGLPLLFREAEAARIGVPFVPDPERGAPPFVQKDPKQVVVRRPAHSVVALQLPDTSLEKALADGKPLLDGYLAEHRLVATGPLRAIPYVAKFSSEGSKEQDYAKIEVRLEVPIER